MIRCMEGKSWEGRAQLCARRGGAGARAVLPRFGPVACGASERTRPAAMVLCGSQRFEEGARQQEWALQRRQGRERRRPGWQQQGATPPRWLSGSRGHLITAAPAINKQGPAVATPPYQMYACFDRRWMISQTLCALHAALQRPPAPPSAPAPGGTLPCGWARSPCSTRQSRTTPRRSRGRGAGARPRRPPSCRTQRTRTPTAGPLGTSFSSDTAARAQRPA
jgi:hypothetical protein